MLDIETPIDEVPGIPPRFVPKLQKLGVETVRDLLWHFPTRYEDFSRIYSIADLEPGQECTIQGEVVNIQSRRTWKRHLFLVEALIEDQTGTIRATWFNQPYIKNILQPGRLANFSGKVGISGDELRLTSPTYELVSEHKHHETTHTGRVVPIYPETRGLTSKGIRYLIKPILHHIHRFEDIVPKEIAKKNSFPEINIALQEVHFPHSIEHALAAKRRFAFEDLFLLQLFTMKQRLLLQKERAASLSIPPEDIKKLVEELPFALTQSQKQSLWEIIQDLQKSYPMNRLLQGDVGSGKTIIAAIAALFTARENHQTAFMAPTEILARQHYETIKKFFPDFEGGLALLTASNARAYYGNSLESDIKKDSLIKEIAQGKVKIIIGTHALLSHNGKNVVSFSDLAFVVIDEQHRFGVEQRAELAKTHSGSIQYPHFLSMSATPIPRTLSLTLFGDLDVSLITELPKDRKPIITKIVDKEERLAAYAFIRKEVKRGRQVFVICPRIEPPETDASESIFQKLQLKSVKEEFEKLSKKVFPDLRVAMLHGKMKPREKEIVMKAFYEKKYDILVATSVIEVGVDVPNATIMMIEGADRFGLAQLYQFRGRVGRGEHESFCLLFSDDPSRVATQRLQSIVEAKNGFELAEKDLKMRGPGEFLGTGQTGMPDLAMKAIHNPDLVKEAHEAAKDVLKVDATLAKHSLLQTRLEEFETKVHWE